MASKPTGNRLRWAVVWAGFLALVVPILAPPALGQAYEFERLWPALQQPWYFLRPEGAAFDAQGNVYIADTGNNRIQKFSVDGALVTQWGREGVEAGQFDHPLAVAVDSAGLVYVADNFNHRIQVFTSSGRFVRTWGNNGLGPGQFNGPTGIAVAPDDTVYVVDSLNNRVQAFEADGTWLRMWGGAGSATGQFLAPGGIAAAPNGHVYVVDKFNHRIQQFDALGGFVRTWGSQGSGAGQFDTPRGIAIGGDTVFVADTGNGRVQAFGLDGTWRRTWAAGPGPAGIAAGLGNAVIVTDRSGRTVSRYAANGVLLASWFSRGTASGYFDGPGTLALDSAGQCYVSDLGNRRIQKFDSYGQLLGTWGTSGTGDGQFQRPWGVAVDGADQVYVTDYGLNRVQKFTNSGQFLLKWGSPGTEPGQFRSISGIAADSQGHLYVADAGNHRIQKFTAAGGFLAAWGSQGTGPGQFDTPSGVAVGPGDVVYVVEKGNDRVQKFTSTGTYLLDWGGPGTGLGEFDTPDDIGVDADGDVYVADVRNNRIQRFTADGDFVAVIGGAGSAPGELSEPYDAAVDPSGRVFVTDYRNDRVHVFQPAGGERPLRAVVVAAGGPFPGNALWDATQFCANFAYRALTYQGVSPDDIYYLSSDTDLDLTGNGIPDVDADATRSALEFAITQWSAGTDDLVVYLVDHGGADVLRMSGTELLGAAELRAWLDAAPRPNGGRTIVVYDACQSGSFSDELAGPDRVAVMSSGGDENAYFLGAGTISFSAFFWSHVFNGLSVRDAFDAAADAVAMSIAIQQPVIADAGGLAPGTWLGQGTAIAGDVPTIVSHSGPQSTLDGGAVPLFAVPTDSDGISRVWAVVYPPDVAPASADNPIYDLPTVELFPTSTAKERWEGQFDGFAAPGLYQLSIYARDSRGNVSLPGLTSVTVGSPRTRKAVLVAGGASTGPQWPGVETALRAAYAALRAQGYAPDDVRYLAPFPFLAADYRLNTAANLEAALTVWAAADAHDVVLFLVGPGTGDMFQLNANATLAASALKEWLKGLEAQVPGPITVVYDATDAGRFIPDLRPGTGRPRIVLASAAAGETAAFLAGGAVSFSTYFWTRVLNGASVEQAFRYAQAAMAFSQRGQRAQIDDDGNGIGNEKTDGLFARTYRIGPGILFAGDDPIVGVATPPQVLESGTSALLWADGVTSTSAVTRVWAVILPPGYSAQKARHNTLQSEPVEVDLTWKLGTYQAEYNGFTQPGVYEVAVFAMDSRGGVSQPVLTQIEQAGSEPDEYEPDNEPAEASWIGLGTQAGHTFHRIDDEDWAAFRVTAVPVIVQIDAFNLGPAADPYLELYDVDGTTLLDANDDGPLEPLASQITYTLTEPGTYFVRALISPEVELDPAFGAEATYDLRVQIPAGPDELGLLTVVVETAGGAPLPEALVTVNGTFPAWPTNRRGEFNYGPIEPGTYTIVAEKPGFRSDNTSVFIAAGGSAEPRLRLDAEVEVSPSSVVFGACGGTAQVSVTAALDWAAVVAEGGGWLAAEADSGTALSITPAANRTLSPRQGMVRVEDAANGTLLGEVTVTQAAYGDVNHDQTTDAVDVQSIINAVLGLGTPHDVDVTCNGTVDSVDIQAGINAVLGVPPV